MKVTFQYYDYCDSKGKSFGTFDNIESMIAPTKDFRYWYIKEQPDDNGYRKAIFIDTGEVRAVVLEDNEDTEISVPSMPNSD